MSTLHHKDDDALANAVIDRIGKRITIGIPLGLGKPIGFLNALYRCAIKDPDIQLTIITALTLARPALHQMLEKRLVEPILDRLLKDYEAPLYEAARLSQTLPSNIQVLEFFLSPGKYLHNTDVQANYVSSSYTNVIEDTKFYDLNMIAQLVAPAPDGNTHYSVSSNTDLFKDTVAVLEKKQLAGEKIAVIGEVNANLPYMYGDAEIAESVFTDIVDSGGYRTLFAIPRDELSPQDHLIGLYTSCLVPDDACLQIGIGKLSNAVACALILRQQHNDVYQDLLRELKVKEKFGETIAKMGGTASFDAGVYASTEMLSDEYLALLEAGIIKKKVYDHAALQTLLNDKIIDETVSPAMIHALIKHRVIEARLKEEDVIFLKHVGILKSDIKFQDGKLILENGEMLPADFSQENNEIYSKVLGKHLKTGKLIHASFFLGSADFYQQLKQMPKALLEQIEMTRVARTNSILWSPTLSLLQRKRARFINTAMMATLDGSIVSDSLSNLQEVSGVGGQFDFVQMAQLLPGARSIINCRSVRSSKKKLSSNIVVNYASNTLPRYLRDMVVTEYGIADCKSKTDAGTIQALLRVADTRFQPTLLAAAKALGKIPNHESIPPIYQENLPEKAVAIIKDIQTKGYCKPYPFGSDLTPVEMRLANALTFLKSRTPLQLIGLSLRSFFHHQATLNTKEALERLQLNTPKNLQEYFYKRLLSFILSSRGLEYP